MDGAVRPALRLHREPHRERMLRMIQAALGQAAAGRGSVTLVLVDLDRFGEINDALGEAGGDEILSSVAARLERSIAGEGVVERVGDDEFALLVASRQRDESPRSICERVLAELEAPFVVDASGLRLTASIGAVSRAPDAASMLRRARLALAEAKSYGGCRYRLFAPALERERAERLELHATIARVLARDEFQVHYQPIHALPDGAPCAAEALLRWEGGLLTAPDQILAAAHAAGLGAKLEHWVLRAACREAAVWPPVAGRRPRVSVNLSATLFGDPELPGHVEKALADAALDASRLDLELTEESALCESAATSWNLKRLAAMGIGLVLDDFGTRYANFGYLASLPVTRLKIDRSFVAAAPTRAGTRPLLKALIAMARALEIPAVAEGVENAVQLDFVRRHGCAEAQGFHLCPVLRPAALRAWLSCRAVAS